MKKFLLTLSCLSFLMGASLQGQTVTVSPIPHSIEWGTKAFDNSTAFSLVGGDTADSLSVAMLKSRFTTSGGSVQLIIGEKGDAAVTAYAAKIPTKAEGYYLSVASDKVVIAGTDEAGTFHGVQTFLQIVAQSQVMAVTITDYPQIPDRGVIEGYYGNPYSHNDRLRLFDFMGANKMNVYIYGPKDDPYHKAQWRVEYPAAQAAKMTELVKRAHANHVKFVWAVHPGGDIQWNATDSANIVKKFEAMYKLGVRAFCVFFDDISGVGAQADKQAGLLNYLEDTFVKKHTDVAHMMICPTNYSGNGGDYMTTLGTQMYQDVDILWTGNSIVDMINKSDVDMIYPRMKRYPYIWLNYPVNDYCIDHMLMGPTYGNDTNIDTEVSGFASNPMEYCEASRVSLYSLADYTWNLTNYNSQSSWERAIKYIMPDHAEAFHVFCENNIDLGTTYHGLRRANESPRFTAAQTKFNTAMAVGYSDAAVDTLRKQFTLMSSAADELINSTTETELVAEITPWAKVMKCVAQRGDLLMDMYKSLNAGQPELFVAQYLKYDSINTAQKAIRSRDYTGSIKNPNPVVATTFIVPFLNSTLAQLISNYKAKYTYRLDVFPKNQLDGKYFIKYNGKYLTDPDETQNGIAAQFLARDDVKPMRQEWTISLDATSGRFKIVNNQASRYLNENGKFAADPNGANRYDAAWNSYTILRWASGQYSIQNGGSAGSNYWMIKTDGTGVQQSTTSTFAPSNFVFEIVPVDGSTEPTIDVSQTYYIKSGDLYLSNGNVNSTGGYPTFVSVTGTPAMSQKWKFSIDATTKRYKLVNYADSRYINENGVFGTNSYYASWNSYNILELGGTFAIQNAGDAGSSYWKIAGNRITTGSAALADSYVFTIASTTASVGISSAQADRPSYTVDNKVLTVEAPDAKVRLLTAYSVDGRVLAKARNAASLSLRNVPKGICFVTVETSNGKTQLKLNVE